MILMSRSHKNIDSEISLSSAEEDFEHVDGSRNKFRAVGTWAYGAVESTKIFSLRERKNFLSE